MNRIKTTPKSIVMSLAALAAVLLTAGCETYKLGPPSVTGTSVSNPTFGFRGYTLPIPEGFTATTNYRALNTDPVVLAAYRDFFKKKPYLQPTGTQSRQEDRFQISGDVFAVMFEASSWSGLHGSFSHLSPDAQRTLLGWAARSECDTLAHRPWTRYATKLDFGEPAIARFGDLMAAYISAQMTVNDRGTPIPLVLEEYFVLGYTDDIYVICGITDGLHKERLAQVTRELVMKLKL